LRPDAIQALRNIAPYQGGKGHELWVLHQLDIIDKHRLLLTVGSSFQSVNLGAHMAQFVSKIPEFNGLFKEMPALYFRPADKLFPLKAGDKLLGGGTDDEVNEKMEFRFEIALNEPGVVEGKPLLETVHQLTDIVANIFTIITPCLVDI
jgi:hypothetical protein